MALTYTLADFRTDFPEFTNTLDAVVSAALARAKRYYSADVFGAGLWQEAVGLKCATLLVSSPTGFRSRPQSVPESPYQIRLNALLSGMTRKTMAIYKV